VSAVLTSPVTSPFGFDSTAADVVAGIDLRGRRAIVTGAWSGIGIETARALAGAGADVTLAVRDADAGARVAADIAATTGATGVHVGRLDLSDQASVAAFVAGWHGPLDVLVNNAGVLLTELQRTAEGWEMHLATNHLGHFALALGLHGALAAAGRACVVSVSSEAHLRARFDFDDPNFTARPYDAMLAYGQSKTANALFAVEASRRWAREGITPNAVHPGAVYETDLKRHLDPDALARAPEAGGYELKTPEPGGRDERLRRDLAPARGHRRPLLRGLQPGAGRRPGRGRRTARVRRRRLRARPRRRDPPLAPVPGPHQEIPMNHHNTIARPTPVGLRSTIAGARSPGPRRTSA
jgi:NAD(P)-dependent dehydrogenase (short-subunit alcohol dehydrogenase family)